MKVIVRGISDPSRWAGFHSYEQFIEFLESQYPGGPVESDHDSPIDDDAGYGIEPDLAVLMSSEVFRNLYEELKTKILESVKLTASLANYLREHPEGFDGSGNGNGLFTPSTSKISLPVWVTSNPITEIYLSSALLSLSHELAHADHWRNSPQTFGGISSEVDAIFDSLAIPYAAGFPWAGVVKPPFGPDALAYSSMAKYFDGRLSLEGAHAEAAAQYRDPGDARVAGVGNGA